MELFTPAIFEYGDPTSIALAGTETVQDSHETGQRRANPVVKVDCHDGKHAFFFIHVEIQAYLTLDESEMHEYNEIMEAIPMTEKQGVTEILTYWDKLGLEKGRQTMYEMVLALIESRFGPVSAPDRDALRRLPLEDLKHIGMSVIGATSYAELRSHLQTNGT